jgi:hypothetical protein
VATQHRPTRESDHKERARLSRENRAMQRQIAKLKRRLQEAVEVEVAEEETDSLAQSVDVVDALPGCTGCGSTDTGNLAIPNKGTLIVCRNCGQRSWT